AVEAMRKAFESVTISGEVVIGEGELDEAPMLYIGEKVGKRTSDSMEVDIAVDPLDGTTLIAKGLPNVISVIAIGSKGSLLNAPDTYMKKIVVGPKAKGAIDLNKTVRSEEHTSELQSRFDLVCRLLLEKKKYTLTSSTNLLAADSRYVGRYSTHIERASWQ